MYSNINEEKIQNALYKLNLFAFRELAKTEKRGALLGNTTNFSANLVPRGFQDFTFQYPCPETGEIIPFELNNKHYVPAFDQLAFRSKKYALQTVAKEMLFRVNNPLGRGFRVKNCISAIVAPDKKVSVLKSAVHGSCHYGGLMLCSSVWICPLCASKITERRALIIQNLIDQHLNAGGDVLLLTLTIPHTKNDTLKNLLKSFQASENGFSKSRKVMEIKKRIGFIEPIKSLEITYGHLNGWHPHSHQLWFVKKGVNLNKLKIELCSEWQNYCLKRGIDLPSFAHGLDIKRGQNSGNYIAKMGWSLSKEIAKGHTKKGKQDRFAPFDLLEQVFNSYLNRWAEHRFIEYAVATYGLQYISRFPKLTKLYGLDTMTDEQICSAQDDFAFVLGTIDKEDWKLILRSNHRATVLQLCENQGFDYAMQFIKTLKE